MGSLGEPTTIVGEYSLPTIHSTTTNDDPWKRNYFIPPDLGPFTPKRFPLKDVRPLFSQPDYSPLTLLQTHGFGIVKHDSAFVASLGDSMDEDAVTETYLPEINKLVLDTLGGKKLFNLTTVLRQGESEPTEFKRPTNLESASRAALGAKKAEASNDKPVDDAAAAKGLGNMHLPKLNRSQPIRVPHRDYTPLGARQTIRLQSQEILDAAVEYGVIGAEDRICEARGLDPIKREADAIIDEQYNRNGGPRYAMYSIWRPLKKIGRDPITLAPRNETPDLTGNDLVSWPYHNRVPGFKGDWLKEFAMMGINGRDEKDDGKPSDVEWCYLSNHMPNEVLFIKLFDSASLGSDSKHAGAPWHASPEISDAAGSNDPRESIECRVMVFW